MNFVVNTPDTKCASRLCPVDFVNGRFLPFWLPFLSIQWIISTRTVPIPNFDNIFDRFCFLLLFFLLEIVLMD